MSQRMPSHWSAMSSRVSPSRPGACEKASSCTTSGHGREVRVAAAGQHAAAGVEPGVGVLGEVVRRAADEPLGVLADPGVVGRHVVRHVVEQQPGPARRAARAATASPSRTAEPLVDDVAAHAVRRADDVTGPQVGQRGPERAAARRRLRAIARPAGLRSQTPISQTASTPGGTTASQAAPARRPG